MADLGLGAYRFSVSWPRIQPDGSGAVNPAGPRLLRAAGRRAARHGIDAVADALPLGPAAGAGGRRRLAGRDTADRFADYAAVVHDALGDRVSNWTTLNEPWCSAFLGYASGEHAPGRREPAQRRPRRAPPAARPRPGRRRRMRAQRRRTPRSASRSTSTRSRPPTRAARPTWTPRAGSTGCRTGSSWTRCCAAATRQDVLADLAAIATSSFVQDGDLDVIVAPLDMLLGSTTTAASPSPARRSGGGVGARRRPPTPASPWLGSEHVPFVDGGRPVTAMGWEIDAPRPGRDPAAGRHATTRRSRSYITENGAAFDDERGADGAVARPRPASPTSTPTCAACHDAIEPGVPLGATSPGR